MNFLEGLLYFIFPQKCGICGKMENLGLCDSCIKKLETEKIYKPEIKSYEIFINKKIYTLNHCYIFKYDGIIRKKILEYKFFNKPYLANMFCEFFIKNKKVCGFLKNYDIIIAVPMTKKKIRQRGYNQSELIARKIAKKVSNLEFEAELLYKSKETKVQSTLNKKQRQYNVKNVYKVKNEQKINNKNILLFDDIYTTGATSFECVKALKTAGAKSVGLLTIAKDFYFNFEKKLI